MCTTIDTYRRPPTYYRVDRNILHIAREHASREHASRSAHRTHTLWLKAQPPIQRQADLKTRTAFIQVSTPHTRLPVTTNRDGQAEKPEIRIIVTIAIRLSELQGCKIRVNTQLKNLTAVHNYVNLCSWCAIDYQWQTSGAGIGIRLLTLNRSTWLLTAFSVLIWLD